MNGFDLEEVHEGAERIVSFTLNPARTHLLVQEECDCYFGIDLPKREVADLIKRLQALHDQMIEQPSSHGDAERG